MKPSSDDTSMMLMDMRVRPTSIAVAALLGVWASSAEAQSLPWKLGDATTIDVNWDGRGAVHLAGDGSLYVLNSSASEIQHIDPAGKLLWKVGRTGRGPGEFVQAYRLAPRPKGGVVVYDQPTGSLTFFGNNGEYEGKKDLSVRFSQVDGLLETAQGEIVIAGYAGPGSGASSRTTASAIHVFAPDMTLLRSFGPVPTTRDTKRDVLRFWGVGYVALSADGSIWYVRKLPYELHRFTIDGTAVQRIAMQAVDRTADDFFREEAVTWNGRPATRHSVSKDDLPRPAPVVELQPTLVLTGLLMRAGKTIDIVSSDGARRAQGAMPEGWISIIGFDPERSYLWAAALVNDVPVLVRQRVTLHPWKKE